MNIEQIKAALRKHIKISEEATPGPWDVAENVLVADAVDGYYFATFDSQRTSMQTDQWNATFTASARNLSPVMAKVLLMFIEDCETCGIVSGEGMLKRIEPMWEAASK